MITQILRNKLRNNFTFKKNLDLLDSRIKRLLNPNLKNREGYIINQICSTWSNFPKINMSDTNIAGSIYNLWVEFNILKTHQNYIWIDENGLAPIKTEFGDLAFLVEYYFDNQLLNRKLSIIQSKIDQAPNSVSIPLHQLFLMTYWPNITYSKKYYSFSTIAPDNFSFYHILLRHSNNTLASSTICSASYIAACLNLNRASMINQLNAWQNQKKRKLRTNSPSLNLQIPLSPPHSNYRTWWTLTPKPFTRTIRECAYLWWGTDHFDIIRLAKDRIKNIIVLKIGASKGSQGADIILNNAM